MANISFQNKHSIDLQKSPAKLLEHYATSSHTLFDPMRRIKNGTSTSCNAPGAPSLPLASGNLSATFTNFAGYLPSFPTFTTVNLTTNFDRR